MSLPTNELVTKVKSTRIKTVLSNVFESSSTGGGGTNTRVQSVTSTATLTPDVDNYDMAVITAQAAALTIAAPTGTAGNGNAFVFRITDNGTARSLTFNSIYRAIGSALPTTTTISKTIYFVAVYNSTVSKWDVFPSNLEV